MNLLDGMLSVRSIEELTSLLLYTTWMNLLPFLEFCCSALQKELGVTKYSYCFIIEGRIKRPLLNLY